VKVITEGESFSNEAIVKTKFDDLILVWYSLFPVIDKNGNITGVSSVLHDLRDIQEKNKIIKESAEQLKEAERLANLGNWYWDLTSQQFYWSENMSHMFAQVENQEPSMDLLLNLIHEKDRDKFNHFIHSLTTNNHNPEQDVVYRVNSTNEKYIEARGKVMLNDKGEVIRIYGTILEVTEKVLLANSRKEFTRKLTDVVHQRTKQLEVAKNELNNQLDMINLVALISATDADGNIIEVNDAWVDLSGFTRDEIIGANHRIINSGHHDREYFEDMWSTLTSGQVWRGDLVNKSKGGTRYVLDTTILPFFDVNGNVERYYSVSFDVTDQRFMTEMLEETLQKEMELSSMKSMFVSTASHQFRTPLTVIKSSISFLEMQVDKAIPITDETIKKIADRTKREVDKMTSLMDEILMLEKMSNNSLSPKFKKVDLVELCYDIIMDHNLIQDDRRKCEIEILGDPFMLDLDKDFAENAISNMVSNAFKYSKGKEGPKMTMRFKDEELELEVKDYGIGMSEKDKENLFNPFYRGENVGSIGGTGLGTTIMKEYTEINNGVLHVESGLNEGTTVKMVFPRPDLVSEPA